MPGLHFGFILIRDLPQRLLSLTDDVCCGSQYLPVLLRHLHSLAPLHFCNLSLIEMGRRRCPHVRRVTRSRARSCHADESPPGASVCGANHQLEKARKCRLLRTLTWVHDRPSTAIRATPRVHVRIADQARRPNAPRELAPSIALPRRETA